MKNVTLAALLMLSLVTTSAQEDIATIAIKGDQLITYAAENFPAEDPQLIYILIETGAAGIRIESKFYLEKGIELLTKRLEETDQIAIGVYGEVNATVMAYTQASSTDVISEKIESLFKGTFTVESRDGIDIAYEMASKYLEDEESLASVIMLRGTGMDIENTAATAQKSAYASTEKLIVAEDSKNTNKSQRVQAKATNHSKLGGAIALTALTILPELIDIIKE